jgi:hypothetical protein
MGSAVSINLDRLWPAIKREVALAQLYRPAVAPK